MHSPVQQVNVAILTIEVDLCLDYFLLVYSTARQACTLEDRIS